MTLVQRFRGQKMCKNYVFRRIATSHLLKKNIYDYWMKCCLPYTAASTVRRCSLPYVAVDCRRLPITVRLRATFYAHWLVAKLSSTRIPCSLAVGLLGTGLMNSELTGPCGLSLKWTPTHILARMTVMRTYFQRSFWNLRFRVPSHNTVIYFLLSALNDL